ncbi:MAG: hypothetical protein DCC67_18875 [Planctomycetota bacterium]|nr:MAG: hypothetical protein DCC67_18875 [Planctomycetota bacterium]
MTRAALIFVAVGWAALPAGAALGVDTLPAAWAEALAHNPEIAAAELDTAATCDELAAAQAGRHPTAALSGGYAVRSEQRSFIFENPLAPGQTFTSPYMQREGASAAASVRLPLYAGGGTRRSIEGAEARVSAARHRASAARMDLMLAVAEAYVAVLRAQRGVEVAEQELACLEAHQREASHRVAQHLAQRGDHLAAQVAVAEAVQSRLRRLHELQVARGAYNRWLGRPLTAAVELAELTIATLPGDAEELQQFALENRAELAELESAAEARRQDAQRLLASVRPQVSLVGRHDFEENRFQTPQGVSAAGVVVDWSVYDGGRSRRAAAAEEHRAMSIAKLAEDLRSRIALEVVTQKYAELEAVARREVALQAMGNADENLRVAHLRFVQGLAVGSEVLDAQSQRTKAANDYYCAQYDAQLAGIRLRHAVGVLGTID